MSSTPDEEFAAEASEEEVAPEEVEETATQAPEEETAPEGPADVVEPAEASRGSQFKRALMAPSRRQVLVALLLAVLGFATVTQVLTTEQDTTYEGRREEELIDILNGLTGTSDRARREISRLEQTRRELQIDSSARRAAIDQAEQRLQTLNVLAGLVPVTGPGLRITITEETDRIRIDALLDTVQELRTAGAEAMEFNGRVRVVASTSFSDVDGVIHVDGSPVRSPYVIQVIGEPHTLHAGLTFPSGPVSSLKKSGARVGVEELESVDITSVRQLPGAEFAEPAEGQ